LKPQPSETFRRCLLLLLLPFAAFYCYGLGAIPFVGPDEPRYAEVAREMFVRHDWISPTLGGHLWFEKPALLYWLMMVGYRVLGVSEYAARLGPALCGLLTALWIYWFGSRLVMAQQFVDGSIGAHRDATWRRCFPALSALLFLSCAGTIVFSRGASFDIVVTMTVTLALSSFLVWDTTIADSSRGTFALAGFYVGVGLSLLAKGLVGIVVPFGVIGCYYALRRSWPRRQFLLSLVWGLPLALAIAAIWYAPMISRHGWAFIDQFFVQHHFARFVSNKYHHPQPFYFYLPILALLVLPWTICLIVALVDAKDWEWRTPAAWDRFPLISLAWLITPVAFFSFSGSKLPGYILPALPAAALITSDALLGLIKRNNGGLAIRLTGALLFVLGGAGAFYGVRHAALPAACIAGVVLVTLLAGGIALLRPQSLQLVIAITMIATLAVYLIALKCGAPVFAQRESVKVLFQAADARGYQSLPVVQLQTLQRSAEFYAAGRLPYGPDGEPVVLNNAAQVAEAAQRSGGRVLVLVPLGYLGKLYQIPNLALEVIGNNTQVALVVARTRTDL